MDDEAAFLAAMHADPLTRLTRHVYADWLEERGDPRHELVRVCEAMRAVPVWSDDYWAWKSRRNELWTRFPIEWLEATGYDGSDYDPVFRDGVPDGVRERWRLIREFTERWHGVSVPDVGGRRDVVAREEARLGLTLPESVRELIAFAHDVGVAGTGGKDSRILANSLDYEVELLGAEHEFALPEDGPFLRLFFTGPDGDSCCIPVADLTNPDPPIAYCTYYTWDSRDMPVRIADASSPTTTHWVFQQVLGQLDAHPWSPDPRVVRERVAEFRRLGEGFSVQPALDAPPIPCAGEPRA